MNNLGEGSKYSQLYPVVPVHSVRHKVGREQGETSQKDWGGGIIKL